MNEQLNLAMGDAFEKAGYDRSYGRVTVSNRPDLCEFQCNGAMAAARQDRKAPAAIAGDVVACIAENGPFLAFEAVAPGFINLKLSAAYLARFACRMALSEGFGTKTDAPKRILVDYGGPNVANPLHIGPQRSAIIGESVKRILRYLGNETVGDTHMGDWGTPIGLIIEELKARKPELCYFDASFEGPYPEEAPFTIGELEEIYPAASARAKEDEAFRAAALENTRKLQMGDPACHALWQHIIRISVADLKKNYDRLNVHFELWKAESDAEPYIGPMIDDLVARGIAHESQGALVVDVAEPEDKREIPPCLIRKSDGASLYATTDLATIIWRMKDYPDLKQMIYLADKRQELHYTSFFRVARKAGLVPDDMKLQFIGFGTMNGKDGKPFKTRSGGVMRLEALISEVEDAVREKMRERYDEIDERTVSQVALAAIKYGDLSNQATKDYNFDIERFTSFEGNTGPYILYTTVRIKSILRRAQAGSFAPEKLADLPEGDRNLKTLLMKLCAFPDMLRDAAEELAPHKICSFIFELSDAFNSFYHDTPILKEEDEKKRDAYIALLILLEKMLETCIGLLGFEAPEKM
ncbi:MAG: arginine--tRNA ligase [Lachnospiraceae bacterium]|nr:arginine--tRNA ligase [Lachnospiraceae bacterium]